VEWNEIENVLSQERACLDFVCPEPAIGIGISITVVNSYSGWIRNSSNTGKQLTDNNRLKFFSMD